MISEQLGFLQGGSGDWRNRDTHLYLHSSPFEHLVFLIINCVAIKSQVDMVTMTIRIMTKVLLRQNMA